MEQSCLIRRMAILMVTLLQTVKRVLWLPPLTVLVENVVAPMFPVLTVQCFVEDVTTRQWLYFSFPELRSSLLEFNFRKICKFDKLNELKLAWQLLKQHKFTWQWQWPVHQKPFSALWFLDCSLYWMNESYYLNLVISQ